MISVKIPQNLVSPTPFQIISNIAIVPSGSKLIAFCYIKFIFKVHVNKSISNASHCRNTGIHTNHSDCYRLTPEPNLPSKLYSIP